MSVIFLVEHWEFHKKPHFQMPFLHQVPSKSMPKTAIQVVTYIELPVARCRIHNACTMVDFTALELATKSWFFVSICLHPL